MTQIPGAPTLPAIMYECLGRWFAAVLLVGILATLAVGQTAAPRSRPGPAPPGGVLVLRNGQILEGKITRAGDFFCVVLPDGEIRVNPAQVEFACRNLDEAYEKKRDAIHSGDAHAHLQLAEWCERHGLIDAAVRELDQAAAAEPTHPMIELVRRRLLASAVPAEASPERATASTGSSPTAQELARFTRELPPGSVEAFSRAIQPLMLNGCTTSGCHGQQSQSEFHLLRGPTGSPPRQLVTQRNLYATLRWVDRKRPDASPLLVMLGRPHGGDAKIYSDRHSTQYRQIADWVRGLGEAKEDAFAAPRASAPRRVEPHERSAPVDPFDPDIFNRQSRAEQVSASRASPDRQESSRK